MDEARVIIRGYEPETDQACLYATWRNAAFYGAKKKHSTNSKRFFKEKTEEIKDILISAQVRMACLEDDRAFIIGYAVSTDTHLDWIYVKKDYRNKGIGTLLWPKGIETVTIKLTKIGNIIATKKNLKHKENEDAKRDSEDQF